MVGQPLVARDILDKGQMDSAAQRVPKGQASKAEPRGDGSSSSDTLGDGPNDPPQRSFFERIISKFAPGADVGEGASADTRSHTPVAGGSYHGLGNLRRLRVDDVAIPTIEIAAVPLDIGKEALVEAFREHGFSRLPVYKGSLDHPQGLVLLKDLALQHGFGATGRFSLKKLLRPVLFVPPSMPAAVLLQKMQKDRVHMALVIDEYGGVDGLVTIEDLIETVIGEIEDEHDEEETALWKVEKPGVYLAQATAPLAEVEAAIGFTLRGLDDDQDIDTLGGLVFLLAGRVPSRGEIVQLASGAEIEVVDADPRRVKRLRLRLPEALLAKHDPDILTGEGA
jgi:magnesium and cobalt transporter